VQVCVFTKAWRSGAGRYAQELVQGLLDCGAQVIFIAPHAQPEEREPAGPRLQRWQTSRELVGDHPRWRRAATSLQRIGGGIAALLRARLHTRFVIMSIVEPLPVAIPVLALLRIMATRIVFVVHDPLPHAFRLPPRWQWLEREAHRLTYRLATDLVVLTRAGRDQLVDELRVPARKVSVIAHGAYPLGAPTPLPGRLRFLLFGTLRSNKCVREVMEGFVLVARSRPDVRLVVAGEPHPSELAYWQECRRIADARPGTFEIIDRYVSETEVEELVAGCDAMVLAYRNFTSQSGVAILAAFNERPVIGTTTGGLGELFEAGLAGEVVQAPPSAAAVAQAVLAYCERSPEDWRRRAAEARATLAEVLSWRRIAGGFLALLQRDPG
jgi:glycogen(starch) synthase